MNATRQLQEVGQSLWLDNLTRDLLSDGTLRRYIDEFSITGLTSNPTIFDQALKVGGAYDADIRAKQRQGKSAEALFLELAVDDLRSAADMFRPIYDATGGADGWASLEVSPRLVNDAERSVEEAVRLHAMAGRPNLFIKIPGSPAGLVAIEESIFRGVPINVTLLFSREQYVAAAKAYMRGIERRLQRGLDPRVNSVASLFVSRWDKAVIDKVPPPLRNRLGIAVASKTYRAYGELLSSPRWQALARVGTPVQRLLWASTGTKDPVASDTLYVEALAVPNTINTMPDKTLLAFAEHGRVRQTIAGDGGRSGDADEVIEEFARAGVNETALAAQLQLEGAAAFEKSWSDLLARIDEKTAALV